MVLGRQNDIDQILRHGEETVADLVQSGFHMMGEGGDFVETEHGSGPLDRMKHAEQTVDALEIVRVVLDLHHDGLDEGELFGGFLQEGGGELI